MMSKADKLPEEMEPSAHDNNITILLVFFDFATAYCSSNCLLQKFAPGIYWDSKETPETIF